MIYNEIIKNLDIVHCYTHNLRLDILTEVALMICVAGLYGNQIKKGETMKTVPNLVKG